MVLFFLLLFSFWNPCLNGAGLELQVLLLSLDISLFPCCRLDIRDSSLCPSPDDCPPPPQKMIKAVPKAPKINWQFLFSCLRRQGLLQAVRP